MKNLLLLLSFLMLLSCSVQKRKYQKGFYVNRSYHRSQKQKPYSQTASTGVQNGKEKKVPAGKIRSGDHLLSAEADNRIQVQNHGKKGIVTPPDTCDMILFRDG